MSLLAGILDELVAEARREPPPEHSEAARCRASLGYFVRAAWHVVEPVTEFKHGQHLDVLSAAFEDVFHAWAATPGRPLDERDLIVNVPPGHMKSLLYRVFGPAWVWTRRPDCRFILASHNRDLAMRDNIKFRRVVKSEWYQRHFPLRLVDDQDAKGRFENTHTGYSIAVGVGGGTGERYDIGILDDPHDIEDRHSKPAIESASLWVKDTWGSRKSDPERSRSVLIMQRVAVADATRVLLNVSHPPARHICLPARFEAEHPHRCVEDWRSEPGELLWPSVYSEERVAADASRFGALSAAGLLQQRPAPAEGGTFKIQRIQRYETILDGDRIVAFELHRDDRSESERVEKRSCRVVQTLDLAASKKDRADFFVVGTFAITPNREVLVLDVFRDKLEGPDQPGACKLLYARWLPSSIGVEAVQYQLTLVQDLVREGLPAHPLNPDRDKHSRAVVAGIAYENRRFFHPMQAPWLATLEEELRDYPNGEHDDQIDVVAYVTEEAEGTLSSAWEDMLRQQLTDS